MKKYFLLIVLTIILAGAGFCSEFEWYRVKFVVKENVPGQWNVIPDADMLFLDELEKNTTLKVKKEFKETSFENLDEVCKHPFVFMTAEGGPVFTDNEVKNIKEYCLRGGFIFADDCVWQGKGDMFYQGFKKVIEEKIFPGKKMFEIPLEHPVYHCFYDFKDGLPFMHGIKRGTYGIANDKGKLMIFLTPIDLHCGWSTRFWTGEKRMEAIKMGINLVMYALTH